MQANKHNVLYVNFSELYGAFSHTTHGPGGGGGTSIYKLYRYALL